MACDLEMLKQVPLFGLLDDDELAVLASQVELAHFDPRQRIYRIGDPGEHAYITVTGSVAVTTIDEDHQDVTIDQPGRGEFFGMASMLDQSPHQTNAIALEDTTCLKVSREDIFALLQQKPHAGMDMLAVLGRQFHAAQQLVRERASRSPNAIIDSEATAGEKIADAVAGFGGSWAFILTFVVALIVYAAVNVALKSAAWDPYPFILLNLILSMLAALQAPVILMSQNRQNTKDRLRGDLDYEVNRRAESEIQGLARKLNLLQDKIGDVEDLLRTDGGRAATPENPSGG